jgi:hypothetical protein
MQTTIAARLMNLVAEARTCEQNLVERPPEVQPRLLTTPASGAQRQRARQRVLDAQRVGRRGEPCSYTRIQPVADALAERDDLRSTCRRIVEPESRTEMSSSPTSSRSAW